MRILQLSHKPPFPPVDGGCLAMNSITQGLLTSEHSIKLLTLYTDKHPLQPEKFPQDYLEQTGLEADYADTAITPWGAIKHLFSNTSYNISRFYVPAFNERLRTLLTTSEFDVVHLESLFMTPYIKTIRENSQAKVVLRAHNIEHQIWEQLATEQSNSVKKWYLNRLAAQLAHYERGILEHLDGIAAISTTDKQQFEAMGGNTPVHVAPVGIDLTQYPIAAANSASQKQATLFFIGALDWAPNTEGLQWFLQHCWPQLIQSHPDAQFHIAGRNAPNWQDQLDKQGVHFHGEVESAVDFMLQYDVMVVPLLSGSGVRIKVLEGMALGKTVLTTPIGALGIDSKNGKDMLVANGAAAFSQAIESVLNGKMDTESIGKAARAYIENKHALKAATADLISFYQQLAQS